MLVIEDFEGETIKGKNMRWHERNLSLFLSMDLSTDKSISNKQFKLSTDIIDKYLDLSLPKDFNNEKNPSINEIFIIDEKNLSIINSSMKYIIKSLKFVDKIYWQFKFTNKFIFVGKILLVITRTFVVLDLLPCTKVTPYMLIY